MKSKTTLYIAIGFLAVIAIFSYITWNKDKKIADDKKAQARLIAENQRQQKLADNANITVSNLADLINKQMNKQSEIKITY